MARTERQPGSVSSRSDLSRPDVSIIIPARNEERWLTGTLDAALRAVEHFHGTIGGEPRAAEIIVVDNESDDGTWPLLEHYAAQRAVRPVRFSARGAARARNHGRRHAHGRILVFVDADTQIPVEAISRMVTHCDSGEKEAGITALAGLDGGFRAWCWWQFWGHVRRLPLPKAKAMPACMFCTASAFDEFGPFDEGVAIGEEWPILASVYRARPGRFVYDRSIVALTSSRRMDRQRFGYLRTFFKYVWAILDHAGRVHYTDRIR
ncbi:MAG: glycosyltransferase [Planctomycetota bacterium]|nr:glycosyltransferase [Planctomycetota bacterium]